MTNEESIDYIEKWKTDYSVDAKDREVLSMAIKALKQMDKIKTLFKKHTLGIMILKGLNQEFEYTTLRDMKEQMAELYILLMEIDDVLEDKAKSMEVEE